MANLLEGLRLTSLPHTEDKDLTNILRVLQVLQAKVCIAQYFALITQYSLS